MSANSKYMYSKNSCWLRKELQYWKKTTRLGNKLIALKERNLTHDVRKPSVGGCALEMFPTKTLTKDVLRSYLEAVSLKQKAR